jgi:DNA topoisomerase-1
LQDAAFYVVDTQEDVIEESAPPPHITATLLQDAVTLYGWSSSKVMETAQWLFENGLITYPRTDSISIAPEAADEARAVASRLFGSAALDIRKRWNMMEPHAAGAHEGIRPTSAARIPQDLPQEVPEDARLLYALVWRRFVAWYMRPAKYRVITVEMETDAD